MESEDLFSGLDIDEKDGAIRQLLGGSTGRRIQPTSETSINASMHGSTTNDDPAS
jgi:hypothetical protein